MKLSLSNVASVLGVSAMLLVCSAANAATFSVSGEVWENGTTSSVPAAGSSVYSSTPTAVFTLTSSSATNLFNFNSNNGSGDYTLSGFLTSGGDSLSYLSGSSAAGHSINNDLFQFTGTTSLSSDTKYTFEHDDGLLLYLDGVLVVNEGGPTSAINTTLCVGSGLTGCNYTISNPSGPVSFTLDYAEVYGSPAVLETSLPLTGPPPNVTPEPSSLMLLGSGVLGMAGMIRRRLMA